MKILAVKIKEFFNICKYYLYHRSDYEFDMQKLIKRKRSKRAFIIATGPSIKRLDLSLLSGKDCFTISNAFLHDEIKAINPIVHGFCSYHKPMEESNYINWIRMSSCRLPESTFIFTPTQNEKYINSITINGRNIVYAYFSYMGQYIWPFAKMISMSPQAGPLLMLPLVISLGYSEIYLIGCDHTVLRDFGKNITNFYNPEAEVRKNATDSSSWSDIRSELKATITVFNQYEFYESYAKKMGVTIFNLSDDSWLQLFPFADYDEVVNRI